MKLVSADVVCVFEITGERADAQKLMLQYLRPLETNNSLQLLRISLIQWCNPETNLPQTFERGGKVYNRFTAMMSFTFVIDGSYAEAQDKIVKVLNTDEESTLMNIQKVDLALSSYDPAAENK